ncbi:serine/threonine protein kinase [Archangium lansingense]|uniref:Serine/threonine-protein kinase n=1 Tax=Archangium lansingense TaxID=2995310 RepID=A0ABT4A3D3_9BACT|nr:serine/threonine-protein kinase [Archangium lansinium]MCY1076160.1 serine/threonine-protein kinase [Archangium lansinium]
MRDDMNLLQPGTQLDGRYEVVRLLGQGGMAAVYEVRHLGLHSTHALKVLNEDLARNDDIRGRFLAEGRIQARFRHPHIVQVTEIVTTPVAGLVMDYIEGPTLGEFCRGQGLEPRLLLEVFLPVLDAMEEAHKRGVVHRDLKPDNIIIGKDSRGRLQPMVTDFGIAKLVEEGPDGKARTQAGARMGTLLYMSPEQIRGAGEVDSRTDIFALGAILYEAATGRVAFHASSDYDTMKRIVEGTYEPPERVVGGLPPVIAGCIRKALAVDPAERFQDCVAFREALENALDANAQVPQKPSRSYAVTQVENPPVRAPSAPATGGTPASNPAAFAPTHVPNTGRFPAMATPPPAPAPPAPAPPAPVPVSPAPVQRAPVNTVRVSPQQVAQATPGAVSRPSGSPILAGFLSLLCLSGFGQLYNGQMGKGVLGLVGSIVLFSSLDSTGPGGACFWLIWYTAFIVDACMIAAKRQRGKQVGPWEFF